MMVSIIIPFHKGDVYLTDCLNSLSAQEYRDFEVILVLDHYEGNIEALLAPYYESMRIKVLRLEEKTGVASARNMGIDNAEGKYIYFLDSDDYIFEEAIALLVEAAELNSEDMVYGRKKLTYYKRDIFLPTYLERLEQARLRREAEAGQSGESIAEGNESGEDADDEENQSEDEEAGDEDQGESLLSPEEIRYKRRKKAVRRLFRKRKRFRNITILHMLIRRDTIEEYKLRFNEDIKYYSDIPFLAALLDKDINIRRRRAARYIKRKHSDPVNFPALTQIADENRFAEMLKTFYYTQSIVDEEGIVRTALDYQAIHYFTEYFAPKLRRSENDSWRNERYTEMQKLAQSLLKQNIKNIHFLNRRMIHALIRGDLKKNISQISRRLAWRKFKRLLHGKNVYAKYLYRHKYLQKPILNNYIVFESFFGKNYSDSPKYVYEYLAKNCPGKYNFVWVLDNKTKLPYGGTKVKRFSIKYMYYMACSKYFVFNGRQPVWFKKRKDMVFLETWHGTPLKKLVFDLDEVYSASPLYKKEVYKQSRQWDYLIAANGFSSRVFKSCFMYDNTMLEYGYPRNDILHAANCSLLADELRRKLGIPKDKKTILYAPTWRDDEYYGKGSYKFELKLDLRYMQKMLGDEYAVLLRTHYFISDSLDTTGLEGFAYNFSKYDDISELYLISDIIITDYSSVFFDYANLRRPMLFFTYDLEKYRDILRGFYIDIEEELPGPLLFTNEEVVAAIKNIDQITKEYADKYAVFYEKYCGWEDGRAAENVAKKVFGV